MKPPLTYRQELARAGLAVLVSTIALITLGMLAIWYALSQVGP